MVLDQVTAVGMVPGDRAGGTQIWERTPEGGRDSRFEFICHSLAVRDGAGLFLPGLGFLVSKLWPLP